MGAPTEWLAFFLNGALRHFFPIRTSFCATCSHFHLIPLVASVFLSVLFLLLFSFSFSFILPSLSFLHFFQLHGVQSIWQGGARWDNQQWSPLWSSRPAAFPIVQYVKLYGEWLDGRDFFAMCLRRGVRKISYVRFGCPWNTILHAWIKRRWHCRGRKVTDLLCNQLLMPVREYVASKPSGLIGTQASCNGGWSVFGAWTGQWTRTNYCAFPPIWLVSCFSNLRHPPREVDFENRMHSIVHSVLVGCHDVKHFTAPLLPQLGSYAACPSFREHV